MNQRNYRHAQPPRRTAGVISFIVVGAIAFAWAGGSRNPGDTPSPSSSPQALVEQTVSGNAVTVAKQLSVVKLGSGSGYSRAEFGLGDGWPDLDGDNCNTRNEILARDLTGVDFWNGGSNPPNCVVGGGTLTDPYTGSTVRFDRAANPDAVQIDHVVALYDAWRKGASTWDAATRVAFGNDPLNLVAVGGEVNDAKGHADASKWLPENAAYRCDYAARQVAVKAKYGVGVTEAEQNALVATLTQCGNPALPKQ